MDTPSEERITSEEISYIHDSVQNKKKISFSCHSLTEEQRYKFLEILRVFLDECQQQDLYNSLSYCLLELLDNANRANVKRIYFKTSNLDINSEDDYKKGMLHFKENISGRNNEYIQKLNQSEFSIKLLLIADDDIKIQVSNNTKITDAELKRINDKINKTDSYSSFGDAINDIDQTEGSGFGIISIILMLKKINPVSKPLKFTMTDTETIATIEVPFDTIAELTEI